MKTRELLAKNQQADFLAPYLVRFEDKKPQKEEVDIAIQDCLKDFKKNYADMENELQRRYDDSTTELNSLKRFLHRYMDQFSVQEYEKFIQEGWVEIKSEIVRENEVKKKDRSSGILKPVLKQTFNYSENIERYRKIIQQRIVAVKEEANRKYGNLMESIPMRLEQIVEKKKVAMVEEEEEEEEVAAAVVVAVDETEQNEN